MIAAAEESTVETPLNLVLRAHDSLVKTKAWAAAKAETVERRITDAGGEVGAELKAAIADLRAAIGAHTGE